MFLDPSTASSTEMTPPLPGNERHQDEISSVQVAVRIRPSSDKEGGNATAIHALPKQSDSLVATLSTDTYHPSSNTSANNCSTVQVRGNESNQTFTFDHVLPPSTEQAELYSSCVSPLIHSCLKGYNATILAYGQTGSGKTHTVIGNLQGNEEQSKDPVKLDNEIGVIPRALHEIFLSLEKTKAGFQQQQGKEEEDVLSEINQQHSPTSSSDKPTFEYQVKVQFLELYGEQILDLIIAEMKTDSDRNDIGEEKSSKKTRSSMNRSSSKKKDTLILLDGKKGEDAEVVGICQAKVKSAEEALLYLKYGMKRRCTEKTAMNAASSRSHAIFTLVIEQTQRKVKAIGMGGDVVEIKTSKIHFVDLAGSERIKSAKTVGKRMQEGISINKGLLTLGNVISALGSTKKTSHGQGHVPYRDSKLTRLLKGSLGGNSKTLMIACVSPSNSNKDESMNTLRYANRAKNITNHTRINVDPLSRVINELQSQVSSLAAELLQVLSISNLNENDYRCPFTMDRLESLTYETDTSTELPSGRMARPSSMHRPASAPSPINNKRGGIKCARSLESSLPKQGLHPDDTRRKNCEVNDYNTETHLNQTDEGCSLNKNNYDTALHKDETVIKELTVSLKTHTTNVLETEMQLQRVSTRLETFMKDKRNCERVLELSEKDSVELPEMTKSIALKREQITMFQEEKDRMSKKYKEAGDKARNVRELITKLEESEHNHANKKALGSDVLTCSPPMVNGTVKPYVVTADTLKEQDTVSKQSHSNGHKPTQQLPLTKDSLTNEDECEQLCSKSLGQVFPKQYINKPSDYVGCNSKAHSLQKVIRNSQEDTMKHTDGDRRRIFYRKKSCDTLLSLSGSAVSAFFLSNTPVLINERVDITENVIKKQADGGRRKIFHRRNSSETLLTMASSTLSSSFRSDAEVSSLGESVPEHKRIDLTKNPQIYDDLCVDSVLKNYAYDTHSALPSGTLHPDAYKLFAKHEIDASIEIDMGIKDHSSSFFSNFMKNFLLHEEQLVTW